MRRGTGRVTDTTIPALARTDALTSGASAWMISSPRPESASIASSSASASSVVPGSAAAVDAGWFAAAASSAESNPGPMS